MIKKTLVISAILLLHACAQMTPYNAPAELSTTNAATLIIYTPDTEFNRQDFIKPTIAIDGLSLGKLSITTPINTLIHAGNHNITFQRAFPFMPNYEAGRIEFTAVANNTYYIRYSYDFDDKPVKPGEQATSSGASSFRLVTNDTGKNQQ